MSGHWPAQTLKALACGVRQQWRTAECTAHWLSRPFLAPTNDDMRLKHPAGALVVTRLKQPNTRLFDRNDPALVERTNPFFESRFADTQSLLNQRGV